MVHNYTYRAPRVATSLAVEFDTQGGVLTGHIFDISERGLQVDFGEPVLPNSAGRVRFRIGRCLLELDAHVAHASGYHAGLVFAFASEAERSFMRSVLQILQKSASNV